MALRRSVTASRALLDAWRRRACCTTPTSRSSGGGGRVAAEEVQRGFIPFGFTERAAPAGIKLERQGGEVDKWVRTVVSTRGRTGAVDFIRKWGVEDPRAAAEQIWELLRVA